MCTVSHEYRLKLAGELSRISGSYCSWNKQVITPNNVKGTVFTKPEQKQVVFPAKLQTLDQKSFMLLFS